MGSTIKYANKKYRRELRRKRIRDYYKKTNRAKKIHDIQQRKKDKHKKLTLNNDGKPL